MSKCIKCESILQSFLDFAKNPTTYRRRRCGRFIDGIEWAMISVRDGNIEFAKKKDFEYWKENRGKLKLRKKKEN